ncbi:hypothetical protein BH10PSE19_BH10PSE19_18790 [soil metagenome]
MQITFLQKLLGAMALIAIGIIILTFILLHEDVANPTIRKYKSAPRSPTSSQVDHSGVISFLSRLKSQTKLLLHKPPSAWMVKVTNVLPESSGNAIVASLRTQELSAYTEVVNPAAKTVQIKLGPVIKHQDAEEILAKLHGSFPQLKAVIVSYDPMKE